MESRPRVPDCERPFVLPIPRVVEGQARDVVHGKPGGVTGVGRGLDVVVPEVQECVVRHRHDTLPGIAIDGAEGVELIENDLAQAGLFLELALRRLVQRSADATKPPGRAHFPANGARSRWISSTFQIRVVQAEDDAVHGQRRARVLVGGGDVATSLGVYTSLIEQMPVKSRMRDMMLRTTESNGRTPQLRVWPGVLAAVLLVLIRLGLPLVWPEQTLVGVLGGIGGAVAIIAWWLFFSRAPWSERLGAIVLMVAGLAVTWPFVDVSISTGAMGGLLPLLAVPPMGVAFVAWAVATRHLSNGTRRATMAATILLACGVWTLAKTGGFSSTFDNDLTWRWAQTPEDRLVADASAALPPALSATEVVPAAPVDPLPAEPVAPAPLPPAHGRPDVSRLSASSASWPGFRGPGRDGVVRGVRIETDWSTSPPVELWRRPIGPGWSSFAVSGDVLYTQEQRGDDEIVAAYNVTTGKPVWSHRDAARFWESNGGAGPRATPTLSHGRVYTFGATGILNALDAATGVVRWSHDVARETRTKVPMWGLSGSPLVIDDTVIVAVSGTLAAYDATTGTPRWTGPRHDEGESYSSPQFLTIDGIEQIVLLSGAGATSVAPADGRVLWEHAMPGGPILQPALTPGAGVVIHQLSPDGGMAIRRLAIAHQAGGWTAEEAWTSTALKTMSSDFVVHNGYGFGFDGSIMACVDLATGTRAWKGGRYGSGQVVLLPEQDLLLVLAEEGDLALVGAKPDGFREIARVPGIEGKTWNHPVLVGDILLVRNGEEMAAFRLARGR